ncbi:LPS export ABC transporter periplasmic protein LptC [Stappia sp.]|uniref:LPS export ABC transporter periplasmic protein LptC n=1 Tax=Stappia sp. TaxID=1870903 RepID=UPI003D109A0B
MQHRRIGGAAVEPRAAVTGLDGQELDQEAHQLRPAFDGHDGAPRASEDARQAATRALARTAAQRHSKRVRRLRLAVPGIGLVLMLGIFAMIGVSSYLSSLGLGNITLTTDGLVMDSPELSGHDGERSYRVSARRAIQRISDPRIIDLEAITAELRMSADQHVRIVATRGTYNSAEETLSLSDGIDVTTNEGQTARFGSLDIALKTGRLASQEETVFTSSFGSLKAGRMRFDQDAATLTFTDGISMTVMPPNAEKAP